MTCEDYKPWRKLAAAIIEQAVWDYRRVMARAGPVPVDKRRRGGVSDTTSAVAFFKTRAYENLCLFVGVDAQGIRDKLAREVDKL